MTDKKQEKYDRAYIRMALKWAKLSDCKRKQVGALIVKNRMIISDGYNGTPSGFENCCEDENKKTHWYVLHAEANAILKQQVPHMIVVEQLYILPCHHVKSAAN